MTPSLNNKPLNQQSFWAPERNGSRKTIVQGQGTNPPKFAPLIDMFEAGEGITLEENNNKVQITGTGEGLPDAPDDGNIYGRKNKTWAEIELPSVEGDFMTIITLDSSTETIWSIQASRTLKSYEYFFYYEMGEKVPMIFTGDNPYFVNIERSARGKEFGVWSDKAELSFAGWTIEMVADAPSIGELYLSVNGLNPESKYPGTTWEPFAEGRSIVGVGGPNSYISGQKFGNDSITQTIAQMPNHNHVNGSVSSGYLVPSGSFYGIEVRGDTGSTGGGQPMDIRPSSEVCYIWKRVA